ncbi:hypothetical protein CONLIGDRAFT_107640 [Coniochaeta ligniaria NRRL 30616]|uniref:Uncharacterized protein n=1 Tax=Coniochaeta ligniaria NRRL 30616 TaxID=1408157 RepID=A0A1J7I9S1_9PEZI|nr:hypothetical protein CONLIGDRAFT_107640 [Coniochaeta ligniaria NRRL 30616]
MAPYATSHSPARPTVRTHPLAYIHGHVHVFHHSAPWQQILRAEDKQLRLFAPPATANVVLRLRRLDRVTHRPLKHVPDVCASYNVPPGRRPDHLCWKMETEADLAGSLFLITSLKCLLLISLYAGGADIMPNENDTLSVGWLWEVQDMVGWRVYG